MEWWVWVLLIAIVVIAAIVIWWWWSSRRESIADSTMTARSGPSEADLEAARAAASEPVAEAAARVATAPSQRDDLTVIEGIGPKIASVLNDAGIWSFAALADSDTGHLEQILRDANLPLAKPATWPAQARLAAEGKMDELRQMQESLTAGR